MNLCVSRESKHTNLQSDDYGDGIIAPGHYNVTSKGNLLVQGGEFGGTQITTFSTNGKPAESNTITQSQQNQHKHQCQRLLSPQSLHKPHRNKINMSQLLDIFSGPTVGGRLPIPYEHRQYYSLSFCLISVQANFYRISTKFSVTLPLLHP